MGKLRSEAASEQIDTHLRTFGPVITASERAARSLTAAYHRARRAEGLAAWPSPNIQDWQTFVRNTWDAHLPGNQFVLNALQEQSIWADIVARRSPNAAQIAGARDRLATMAMEAYRLLCTYAPQFLQPGTRLAWDQDAGTFSKWLKDFDQVCRDGNLVSAARLPLALIESLKSDSAERPPLLLAGFDRILPTQKNLFAAWGKFVAAPLSEQAAQIEFHSAADPASELAACALWCKARLAANPHARLLVVAQDAAKRRGEIERAFLRYACSGSAAPSPTNLFEFSLGVPLGQIALARSAGLLLHWLDEPIEEPELDWLIFSGHTAANPEESLALTSFMRQLRRRGWQRTRWMLADFLRQAPGRPLPEMWKDRLTRTQLLLQEFERREQSPLACAELVPQLLQTAGWPGARPLSSAEFQALRRWQQIVDDCASLGFDSRRIKWADFLAALDRSVSESLFSPESEDAPILIAGPAESAGLTADGVWFLGASEDAWPAAGATHPLLPLAVQRQAGMPHATAQFDWDLAAAVTRRLLSSAPEIHFSYPLQSEGVEARPSRLALQLAGTPQSLPSEFIAPETPSPLSAKVDDESRIPFPRGSASGGSSTLTAQSQCAFKAFAIARLGADGWDPAEAGLNAKERGQLLHAVLHSIWGDSQHGIRSHAELVALPDLTAFVADHVRRVLQSTLPVRARDCMPQRYLALEETRLISLVTDWLRYESARVPFAVLHTEHTSAVTIDDLPLELRLDRIDRLIDDSLFVIDYKSGDPKTGSWDLPRPDDVQLPLYANFALDRDPDTVGGLAFAKVRAGEAAFVGLMRDAKGTLIGKLRGNTNLVKNPLSSHQLAAWRACIEQLARDFLSGRAVVNPLEYPKTCEHCGLQALCRVQEFPPQSEDSNAEESADA